MTRLTALDISSKKDESDVLENTISDTDKTAAKLSASAASRQRPSLEAYRRYIACDLTKSLLNIFKTPCEHHYCQRCLRTLFKLSITDETLFPSRSCRQEIPLPPIYWNGC